MEYSTESLSQHVVVTCSSGDISFNANIISEYLINLFLVMNFMIMCTLIGLFGAVSNVINLVVFYKQGLNSSINITFFALAISDLCGLIAQFGLNIFMNPLIPWSDVSIVPAEFQYMFAGLPRATLSRVTGLITVYATMERCLCIAFPLHVKQMITPRRTAIVMGAIYSLTFISIVPFYCTTSIGWRFYPDRNKTFIGLVFSSSSEQLNSILYVNQAAIQLVSFVSVVCLTAVLIGKLAQKSDFRQSAIVDQVRSESLSNRDRKAISMVVLIASILIVCNIPSVILYMISFFVPKFSVAGDYVDMLVVMWSFGFLFETINSSVNIFLYFKMSTKYRNTFHQLFVVFDKLKRDKVMLK